MENTSTRIEKDATVALVSHLLRVDLSTLSRERVGALHGRITRSVEGFVKFLKLSFMDFFPAIITAVVALAVAIVAQPWLGLIMAGVVPVATWISIRQVISQKGIRLELLRAKEHLDGTVVEQLGGIEYVRAANTVQREVERVARVAEGRRIQDLGHHVAMAWFDCAKAINEGFFHILVLSFAIFLAVKGQIGYGDILMFSILFFNVMNPLREVHRILDEAHESSLRVGDLLAMMNEPTDQSFGTVTMRQPKLTGEEPIIVLDNVSMEYISPEGQRRRGLDRISMSIRHGETIGAAGPAGSGKSTWLKVLMRLVHPSDGVALLGGVPLDVLSRQSIGELIGYVSQTPFIVSGTIEENIAYGTDNARSDDVVCAAKQAHIHDEIMAMPGGYQAMVAERGQNLSGGQRQRLALARIFLKNPPVLILDEGTSALDNINERNIQRAIAEARKDRTVIMVAHRLSTLRPADRIFVFKDGRIVETGPYDELLRQDGVFAELVRSADDGHDVARPVPA